MTANVQTAPAAGTKTTWKLDPAHTLVKFSAKHLSLSDCAGEPTGLYFDRNGKAAWVHVQHAGGTLRNDLLVAIAKE